MKKIFILLLTGLLIITLPSCAEKQDGVDEPASAASGEIQMQEEEPIGTLRSATIIFDFSSGSSEGNFRQETYQSYSETISDDELIYALSSMSGLDFNVTLSMTDSGRLVADWAADSTLIAGLDDREQQEDFFFYDVDSLRWFMMDSLWRTLGSDEIYYTMDGGKELVFNELYAANVFPSDVPYMGSAFYFAHSDVVGDFSYIDEEYNLVLHYSNSFSQEPEINDGYTKRFPSLNDDSVLHYWVIPNTDGTTPENFYDTTPATIIGIEKNVVYGWGNELNQLTGEETVNAYYWLVKKEWIACVAICCQTEDEAFVWCKKIIDDKSVFVEDCGEIAEEVSVFSESEAMDILSDVLDMAEGTAIVSYGEDTINGIHCWTFAYGSNSPEKFTAEVHYAVTDYGRILVFDSETAGYKELYT